MANCNILPYGSNHLPQQVIPNLYHQELVWHRKRMHFFYHLYFSNDTRMFFNGLLPDQDFPTCPSEAV